MVLVNKKTLIFLVSICDDCVYGITLKIRKANANQFKLNTEYADNVLPRLQMPKHVSESRLR